MIEPPGDSQSESGGRRTDLSVVFMGTADFSVPSLQALIETGHRVPLVVTRAARPAGRCAVSQRAGPLVAALS